MQAALKLRRARNGQPTHASRGQRNQATQVAKVSRAPAWISGSSGRAVAFAGVIQPKVVVGSIHDPYEREADQVAHQVAGGQSVSSEKISRLSPGHLKPVAKALPAQLTLVVAAL